MGIDLLFRNTCPGDPEGIEWFYSLARGCCEGGTSSQQGRWQVDIPKRYSEAAFFFWFFAFRKVGFASYQGWWGWPFHSYQWHSRQYAWHADAGCSFYYECRLYRQSWRKIWKEYCIRDRYSYPQGFIGWQFGLQPDQCANYQARFERCLCICQ